jgi:dienelactone hydrolase
MEHHLFRKSETGDQHRNATVSRAARVKDSSIKTKASSIQTRRITMAASVKPRRARRGFVASILVGLVTPLLAAAPAMSATKAQPVSFAGAGGLTLQGWLYEQAHTGQQPAVVAMHGCSGLTEDGKPSERHEDWGQRLSGQGFVVLFPDSFGSRGLGPQCKVSDREVRPSNERVDDAKAALAYLAARANVKPQSISLMGWSNGGSTVLYTVEPKHAPRSGPDFAKAVAFYPGCRVPLETGLWKTRMPLLVLIGAADDWTAAPPCADLIAAAKASGAIADIVTYPNAYHDFDHPNLPIHTIDGLAFTASGTGQVHTGTNPAARADAIMRVPAFLAR